MSKQEIEHFDDLKAIGLSEPRPQRLLFVLLHAEVASSEAGGADVTAGRGTLSPVMATDLALTPELEFAGIIDEADSLGHPWEFMLVSSLSGRDGREPTPEQVEPCLQAMAEAVMTGGDLSPYVAFDRAGMPVRLTAEAGA